ncbi:transposase, partial [bacterium AH-315-M05]|nr:transposase [bacterium AH-315-M05]
ALDQEFDEDTKDKLEHNKQKKANYQNIGKQLKETGDGQISTTDPDSKAVVFQRTSVKVGYNVQAASDGKNKLLIAADTGDVNDTKALSKMVEEVQLNIGEQEMDVLADKGYHSGRELKKSEELGVTTYISPKESSSSKTNPDFAMESFEYDSREDTYTCPAGQTLKTNGRWYNKQLKHGRKSYHIKHYKTKACQECELRSQCTTNKLGRIIERTQYQEYVDRNNDRVNQNPEYYRQRQQIIEHQFGTLKRQWNFEHTWVKGKEKVLGEVFLEFTCYNLKRSLSILGFDDIMARINAIIGPFSAFFNSILAFKRAIIEYFKNFAIIQRDIAFTFRLSL